MLNFTFDKPCLVARIAVYVTDRAVLFATISFLSAAADLVLRWSR